MDVIGRPHKKLIDGYVKGKMIIEGHIRRQLTDMWRQKMIVVDHVSMLLVDIALSIHACIS